MIVDAYGRPIASFPVKPIIDPIGAVRVRDQWSTYPSNGLTPQKLAGILRDADAGDVTRLIELAEETEEKDLHLSSTLHTRKLAVQHLEWEVLPASDAALDQDIAEFVGTVLEDLDLDEPILHLLDALYKGYAAMEIAWDVQGKKVWPVGLERIPQKRFTFLHTGVGWDAPLPKLPNLLTTAQPVNGIEIPAFKILFHKYVARSGFTQNLGLFRGCVWLYLFKNFSIKDWVVFLEKYGQPLRVGKYMPSASEDAISVLKRAVADLGTDAAAVISDQTLIEIIESKLAGSHDGFEKFAEYVDKQYEIGILGQTGTTQGTPGKLGAEKERADVRRDLLKADARALERTLRAQLIWPMVVWNFPGDNKLPEFVFHCEDPEDLKSTAETHKILWEMGAPIPVSYIQKKYGLPEATKGEALLSPPSAAVSPPPSGSPPSPANGTPPVGGATDNQPIAAWMTESKKKVPIGSRLVPYEG